MKISTIIVPSSDMLRVMIDRAMAKCDADVEQARLAVEARADAAYVRRVDAEVHGRHYRRVQNGT